MKVFKNDTVKLILNTGMDISSFTNLRIKYESPNNVTGYWSATLCGASNLCLEATVKLNESGIWKVQAYVRKNAPVRIYHGKIADVQVFEAVSEFTTAPPTTTLTTAPPSTAAPTTLAPTTAAPTTLAPTTAAPTSLAPTT